MPGSSGPHCHRRKPVDQGRQARPDQNGLTPLHNPETQTHSSPSARGRGIRERSTPGVLPHVRPSSTGFPDPGAGRPCAHMDISRGFRLPSSEMPWDDDSTYEKTPPRPLANGRGAEFRVGTDGP